MTDEDVPLCVDRALCRAAWEGHTETVRTLLDAGADVHAWTDAPLWEVALNGGDTKSHEFARRLADDVVADSQETGGGGPVADMQGGGGKDEARQGFRGLGLEGIISRRTRGRSPPLCIPALSRPMVVWPGCGSADIPTRK
jgi:hypothetical protein